MQMSLLIKDKRRNAQKTPNTRAEGFLHRMLFKVANEASAALFIPRLFAVWILQRSRLLPGLGLGLPPLPSISQPGRAPRPSLSPAPTRLKHRWQEENRSRDITTPVATRTVKQPVGIASVEPAALCYGA